MFSNKINGSLLCQQKMTVKERKRTLSGILHDALYRLPWHLPFKMAAEQACRTIKHEQPRLFVRHV